MRRRFPPIRDTILHHIFDETFDGIKPLIAHLRELQKGDVLFLDKEADYKLTRWYGPFNDENNMGLSIEFLKHPGENVLHDILKLIIDNFEKNGSELIKKSEKPEFRDAVRTEVDAILEKYLEKLTGEPNQGKPEKKQRIKNH